MQWHLTPQIIFKWNCNADSPGSQEIKHFSAQWASWCHLKIAADTLIFKQNRRDVDYLFFFTLILLLNHLSFFFQTLKQQNSPFYQRLLLEVAGWVPTWQLQSTKAFFSAVVPTPASIPRRNYTENIFCSGQNSSYNIWLWSLYLWAKLIFNTSNFLCLVILSKMSKYIITELPDTWKTSHFLLQFKRERKRERLRKPFGGIAWFCCFMSHSATIGESDRNVNMW